MSTGNQSYGYVGGGEPPSVTTMNRIDYASVRNDNDEITKVGLHREFNYFLLELGLSQDEINQYQKTNQNN